MGQPATRPVVTTWGAGTQCHKSACCIPTPGHARPRFGEVRAGGTQVGRELCASPPAHRQTAIHCVSTVFPRAPVAQLDRAAGFEPVGRGFESLRARQISLSLPNRYGQFMRVETGGFSRLAAPVAAPRVAFSFSSRASCALRADSKIAFISVTTCCCIFGRT